MPRQPESVIRRIHGQYQEAYGRASYASKRTEAEVRHRAGMVHRDGRPVTLINSDTSEWAEVDRLAIELRAARGYTICQEHGYERPEHEPCIYDASSSPPGA